MSKYISINEFDTFKFHDAQFDNIEINNENMIWELEKANVTKANSQNDLDTDMEVGLLLLTFKNCKVTRIEHFGCKYYDKAGNLIKEEPNIITSIEDYLEILNDIPSNHGWISRISSYSKDQNRYRISIDILTFSDSLIIDFEFSEVKAEWDIFKKEAWYISFAK